MEKRENVIRLIEYLVAQYVKTDEIVWLEMAVRQLSQLPHAVS